MNKAPTSSSILRRSFFTLDREPAPLVVVKQDTLLSKLLSEHPVFSSQILDHLILLPIDAACEDDETRLPRLENGTHDRSIAVRCTRQ